MIKYLLSTSVLSSISSLFNSESFEVISEEGKDFITSKNRNRMTQINNLVVIEVPDDAYDLSIEKLNDEDDYTGENYTVFRCFHKNGLSSFELSEDKHIDYKILGKLSDLSEEECSRFVEKVEKTAQYRSEFPNGKIPYYKSYTDGYYYSKAKYSLISLLQSKGIDTNNPNRLLLLEKL